jgi:hypothetical protein
VSPRLTDQATSHRAAYQRPLHLQRPFEPRVPAHPNQLCHWAINTTVHPPLAHSLDKRTDGLSESPWLCLLTNRLPMLNSHQSWCSCIAEIENFRGPSLAVFVLPEVFLFDRTLEGSPRQRIFLLVTQHSDTNPRRHRRSKRASPTCGLVITT